MTKSKGFLVKSGTSTLKQTEKDKKSENRQTSSDRPSTRLSDKIRSSSTPSNSDLPRFIARISTALKKDMRRS